MRKYNCFTLGQMSENYCNEEQLEIPFNANIAYYRMPNKGVTDKDHTGEYSQKPKTLMIQHWHIKFNTLQGSGNETKRA